VKKQTRIFFLLAIVSLGAGWLMLHRQNDQLSARLASNAEVAP